MPRANDAHTIMKKKSPTQLIVITGAFTALSAPSARALDFFFESGHGGHYSGHYHHSHSCYDPTVAWAQRILRCMGYYRGCVDGVFGSETRNALIRYQCDHGLAHTGRLDCDTVQMLREE
jgi:hypothetical protein